MPGLTQDQASRLKAAGYEKDIPVLRPDQLERLAAAGADTNKIVFINEAPDVRLVGPSAKDPVSMEARTASAHNRAAERLGVKPENLDLGTGIDDPAMRFNLAFAPTALDKMAILENAGFIPKRIGNRIFANYIDQDSLEEKSLAIDELGASAQDLIDFAPAIGAMGAAILATRGGRGSQFGDSLLGGLAKDASLVGRAAGGSAGFGIAADSANRAINQGVGEINLSESILRRGSEAAVESMVGLPLSQVIRAVRSVRNTIGAGTPVASRAREATQRLNERLRESGSDQQVVLSPGAATGDPRLQRAEGLVGKISQSESAAFERQTQAALRTVRESATGAFDRTAEDLGEATVDALRQPIGVTQEATRQSALRLNKTVSDEIFQLIRQGGAMTRGMPMAIAANNVRRALVARREQFKMRSKGLYGKFDLILDDLVKTGAATEDFVPTAQLRKAIKEISPRINTALKTVDTGLVTPEGEPLSRLVPTKVPGAISSGLRRMMSLFDEISAKGNTQTLAQMRNLRDQVADMIEETPINTSLNRDLLKLEAAVKSSIDDGLKALPTPDAKNALKAANDYYAAERPLFQLRGVTEALKPQNRGFAFGDNALATVLEDPDAYLNVKRTLGVAGVPQLAQFRQAMVDTLYQRSLDNAPLGTVDFTGFAKKVSALPNDIRNDLFTPGQQAQLNVVSKLTKGKISQETLQELLQQPTPSITALRDAIRAQDRLDKEFANGIVRKYLKGEASADALKASEFVGRFVDDGTYDEIAQVLGRLNTEGRPDLVDEIGRRTLESLFAKVDQRTTLRKLTDIEARSGAISPEELTAELFNEGNTRKLRLLLGDDVWNLLSDYTAVQQARAARDSVAGNSGGLLAGSILNSMFTSLQGLTDLAKYTVVSKLLYNPAFAAWAQRPRATSEFNTLMRIAIAAPQSEFLRETFPDTDPDMIEVYREIVENNVGAATDAMYRQVFGVEEEEPLPEDSEGG